ncbi:MAG: hypothetical protein RLZZ592_1036 [Pseudomonadota bacterium]|jgi:K(+)-stimulated pyrophosphate-energized sodium pump|nr:hypothetical protein [Pseudomonadota bacterium]
MGEDDRDESRRVGLWVVFVCVAVLLLGVLGLAVSRTMANRPQGGASAVPQVELAPSGPPLAVLYFEIGSATLTPRDAGMLEEVVQVLGSPSSRRVLLSGYHDASGDPERNAALARQRAQAVRDALIVAGVPLQQVLMRRPQRTTGTGASREARRVEIRIVDAPGSGRGLAE